MFGGTVGGMGRAWNGNLLGTVSGGEGLLIVPRLGEMMAVFRRRNPATALPGDRVEDFAGANVQVLLGQSDAPLLLLQPTPVCFEAAPLQVQIFPDGGSGWSTEDRALFDEAPRREVSAEPLDFDPELAPDDQQRRRVDHGRSDATRF